MRISRSVILGTLMLLAASISFGQAGLRKVEFITGTISDEDGDFFQLHGGSTWEMLTPAFVMSYEDVIVVVDRRESTKKNRVTGIAYIDGNKIRVRLVRGSYFANAGYFTKVIESRLNGAILKLADGTLLEIPQYDQFDTGWWLPPYDALLTGDEMYLWNLEKGKKVWVDSVRGQ